MSTKDPASPAKFVKPADLFKMRRRTSSPNFYIESQSPLKCLNNLSEPSPTKDLPTILKNPFNQPVKRRLNLGCSPKKTGPKMRSPNKRTKMFELDEDANLEPPKMKPTLSPRKKNPCYQNDWSLRTKLKVNFAGQCKNWNGTCASTHKRHSINFIEESPSKLDDRTISIEAIKNASTVYQHPYLAWLSLYPRESIDFEKKVDNPFKLTEHSEASKMMHKAWCESLNDLTSLLIYGRCPYFYMCANNYNILFKKIPTSNPRRPLVQAYISPFSYGMGCELNKLGIEFKCPDLYRSNSNTTLSTMGKDNSQASSFGSSQSIPTINNDEESSQNIGQASKSKVTSSVDSGNVSDLDDEDDFGEDENEDTSQFLESIGLSQQNFPSLHSKRKGFIETDSNTQSKSTSNKPLATTEGKVNVLKLIKFLQTNRLYTISNVGKFACVPPTLLSPTEFRLSTPQYPEVVLSKNMIEFDDSGIIKQTSFETPKKIDIMTDSNSKAKGPTFIELKGTILPNLHKELHKLLSISDNTDHSCSSTMLDSSVPFQTIQFST